MTGEVCRAPPASATSPRAAATGSKHRRRKGRAAAPTTFGAADHGHHGRRWRLRRPDTRDGPPLVARVWRHHAAREWHRSMSWSWCFPRKSFPATPGRLPQAWQLLQRPPAWDFCRQGVVPAPWRLLVCTVYVNEEKLRLVKAFRRHGST